MKLSVDILRDKEYLRPHLFYKCMVDYAGCSKSLWPDNEGAEIREPYTFRTPLIHSPFGDTRCDLFRQEWMGSEESTPFLSEVNNHLSNINTYAALL